MPARRDNDDLSKSKSSAHRGHNDEAARQKRLRYRENQIRAASEAVARGHVEEDSLRELLIHTTDKNTAPIANAYFARFREDAKLLESLIRIALEGEDAGDAPWAAANIIADYPATMLEPHLEELEKIAREQWEYLHIPARRALAKIAAARDAS